MLVARPRGRGAEHRGQLGGQVGERPVRSAPPARRTATCFQYAVDMRPILPVARERTLPERAERAAIAPTPYADRVPSLIELVRSHTDLDDDDVAWLQLLMRTGRSSPTSPSPTWCCGCPTATATGFWAGAPDAAHDRPHGVRRRRRRHLRAAGRRPLLDARYAEGRLVARGRPGVARRRAGAGRDDPGAARRAGDRRGRPQHQPARRAHAQPAGAVLPPDRRPT